MKSMQELWEKITELQVELDDLRSGYIRHQKAIEFETVQALHLKKDIEQVEFKKNQLMNEYLSCDITKVQATKLGKKVFTTGRFFPNQHPVARLTNSI
jgi:hypothetical protein